MLGRWKNKVEEKYVMCAQVIIREPETFIPLCGEAFTLFGVF